MLLCIIAACLNVFSYAETDSSVVYQPSDTTTTIILDFSEVLSVEGLFDVNNYSVKDSLNNSFLIYKIGLIQEINGVPVESKTMIAVITERLPYKKNILYRQKTLKTFLGTQLKTRIKGNFSIMGLNQG